MSVALSTRFQGCWTASKPEDGNANIRAKESGARRQRERFVLIDIELNWEERASHHGSLKKEP